LPTWTLAHEPLNGDGMLCAAIGRSTHVSKHLER
jgi:hypothetical protein